jgi:hypothetical protein
MACVNVLLPALITTEEQKKMTESCKRSIFSLNHCIKLKEDHNKYETKVAGVWNAFLDEWRGKDYEFLLITANDTILDPNLIDFGIETLNEHPKAGVCTFHVTRDLEEFKKGFGQSGRSGRLTKNYANMDPANFMIRKGVIEKVGRVDEQFPCEFVERDFWRRCEEMGFKWIEPEEVLNYHPPYAGTIGNDVDRLQVALRKYVSKHGGDAGAETFDFPYNDSRLDWTFTGEYTF